MRRSILPLCLALLFLAAGCGESGPSGSAEPPEGWETVGTERWWRADVDTAVAFRNLDTLATMGIEVSEIELIGGLQRRLTASYRNHPEVVDSVFNEHVAPAMLEIAEAGEYDPDNWENYINQAYREIGTHFMFARHKFDETPIVDPRPAAMTEGGTWNGQIYIDETGTPAAIETLQSTGNETLDALIMRMMSELTYVSAYVRRGSQEPLMMGSWIRQRVRLPARTP